MEHRGLLIVRSFFCLFVPPSRFSGLKSALSGLKTAFLGLKSVLSELKLALAGLKYGLSGLNSALRPRICAFRPPIYSLGLQITYLRPETSPLRLQIDLIRPQTSPLSPSASGLLPCFPSFLFTTLQSRATGIADHILPLGNLFYYNEILGLTAPTQMF